MSTINSMQKGFSLPILIVGVLIIITALIGAYYLGTRDSESTKNTIDHQTTSPSAMATSKTEQTSEEFEWKAYSNKDLGISFEYPGDWVLVQETYGGSGNEIPTLRFNKSLTESASDEHITLMFFDENIDYFINRKNGGDTGHGWTGEIINQDSVDGRRSIKVVTTLSSMVNDAGDWEETGKYYNVYVDMNEKTLNITADIKDRGTIDKLLETLKFTK